MSPIKALSPVNYYGLTIGTKHKALSRSGLSWRIASRSLFRRQSVSIRIIILLCIVFILLTVSVAGGIIANDTTVSWVQKTVGSDTIAVAHPNMGNQYKLLLAKFAGERETGDFNYSDPKFAISNTFIEQLSALSSVSLVDSRLIVKEHVKEIGNFTIAPDSLATLPVGDSREGESIVIGVDPKKTVGSWSIKGRFLSGKGDLEAVIGDSISHTLYSPHPSKYVVYADPLLESISFQNKSFRIVGVCVDPINNGLVTYVPLEKLENTSRISSPNLLLVKLNNSTDRNAAINEVKSMIQAVNPDLDVFDLGEVIKQNAAFLASNWQTIMLLPLLTLTSAALCLVGYMMLAVDEQHQEFAILRAVGTKPRVIVVISAIQSFVVLISSFAAGISLGVVITLLILMKNPLVTSFTILEIAIWLIAALIGMFLFSLYPAYRLAKTPILKIRT